MPKSPDTDYVYLSTLLKALEKNMLSKEDLTRLTSARTDEDAVKLLTEKGWNAFDTNDSAALEQEISHQRKTLFDLIYRYVPEAGIIDLFRLKYDYHNLKALIKATAQGLDGKRLLSDAGTITPTALVSTHNDKDYSRMHPIMATAAQEAADLLARTGDPQLCDLLLDGALAAQMLALAEATESEFLLGYVRLWIDLGNLRVLTRAALSKKGFDYLQRAIFPGGKVACGQVREVTPELLRSLFGFGALTAAAESAAEALSSGLALSGLDMACDNTLIEYIRTSRLIPFGEATVISHLLAFESQLVAVRIVMSGRASGLGEERIAERLRMSYV
ncbi:MAG TPA: V-type ATPase subunit [Clostridia bacterium]|nr:V-type ATPase subunit [Clostridia bacterium]